MPRTEARRGKTVRAEVAMRLGPEKHVWVAADGHLVVSWPDASWDFFAALTLWLRVRHGLRRSGRTILGIGCDQHIFPDFVGADFRLSAGWDNWSGCHLHATDDAGDRFLGRVFARGIEPRPFVG